jgi:hypothetical protein
LINIYLFLGAKILSTPTNNAAPIIDQIIGKSTPPILNESRSGKFNSLARMVPM